MPIHEDLVKDVRPTVLALFGAVIFVLLIACANVANLLIVALSFVPVVGLDVRRGADARIAGTSPQTSGSRWQLTRAIVPTATARGYDEGRVQVINLITTNESLFDSLTLTVKGRTGRARIAELRAGELAPVGRSAGRVVQRPRHRRHARRPVP